MANRGVNRSGFPRNHVHVGAAAMRIRELLTGRSDQTCVILVGPGGETQVDLPSGAVVFAVGYPTLAEVWPARIDGHFCAGPDRDRDRVLLDRIAQGLRVGAFFRPDLPGTEDGTRLDLDRRLQPSHDPWTLLAEHPTLARFFMGNEAPSVALQALACAAALGFRDIQLAGVAFPTTSSHERSLDMMFLRAVRACFDIRIRGLPRLDTWAAAPVPAAPDQREGRSRYAYVTLVVGDYVFGAMALARSLARVSDVPLIVLHPEPEAAGKLAHLPNVILCPVAAISNPNSHGRKALAPTYTKLRAFELLDYARLVFIDADCVALQSPDGLFATRGFCAAPNWGIGLGMKTFNSGVFSFSPSKSLCNRIMTNINLIPSNTGGDQGYLNALLCKEWTRLPPEYNTLTRQLVLHPTLTSLSDVRILHFTGQKPWRLGQAHGDYSAFVDIWLGYLEPEDWRLLYWRYSASDAPVWSRGWARRWFRSLPPSVQLVLTGRMRGR